MSQLVSDGFVQHLLHDVYLWGRDPGLADRVRAASLILPPGGVIARRTAAWLFGIDTRSSAERHDAIPVECVVPQTVTPARRKGLRCFAAELDPGDITDFEGIPCTTPVRTTADLLRWLPVPMGLTAADAFAAAGLVNPPDVERTLTRWPGDRFIAQARLHAGWIEPLTESAGETWLRLRILEAGFPRPEAQIPIIDNGELIYRLDLGWRDRRIGIEYDGREFHEEPEDQGADKVRRKRLKRDFGWTVTGVGLGEVFGRSLALENGVGELLGLQPTIQKRRW